MNITRSNYEEFVLDYLEGTLSEELRLAMQQFLQQNADLKQELSEFSAIIINPDETIQLPNKANLLCDLIALDNYEEYAIDYIEQTLPPETQLAMTMFLDTEPLLKNELNNFTLVTASADESVIYEHKEQLKKRAGKTGLVVLFFANPLLRYAAAVAALLLLWQPLSNMFNSHEMTTALPHLKNNSIASNKSVAAASVIVPNTASTNNRNMHNTPTVDKGTDKLQNNQLTKPTKMVINANLTSNGARYSASSMPNVVAEKQHIPVQNTLVAEQTTKHILVQNTLVAEQTTLRAATPIQLASLDAKNVLDNTVINYIITPKSISSDTYTDAKPNLLKRLGNRSNNAETMFAQNVLSRLPNSLLPQNISDGLSSRRRSVSVEVPIQPETHERLKNFLGNK
ncbi:MAG: hypothetical protein KA783_06405 [Chitinophagales bacterium]|nr:hypothetical protein [Sphingobacteriales bacterium]MBP6664089.1 hypothetical protein [Chitinophagales bacterium]MBP7534059.1 hypothetical protein [Chitinophagales bacterium]